MRSVFAMHDALGLRDARLGKREVALLLVHLEVRALDQLASHGVGDAVWLRVVLRRAGDDERRPRLIYQYRVNFVDDAVVVAALHLLRLLYRHVVAQVVEAELAVRAVGYVAAVGLKTRVLWHEGRNDADRQPHSAVDRPHPLRVARGEVVVDRDDVDALRDGERGDERLSFARLHLGDVAVVERHASDELLLEVAQAERALRDLADARENLGQYVVEALALFEARAENFSRARELLVRKLLDLRLERIYYLRLSVFFSYFATALSLGSRPSAFITPLRNPTDTFHLSENTGNPRKLSFSLRFICFRAARRKTKPRAVRDIFHPARHERRAA